MGWISDFIAHESGAVFNFVVAHILFWSMGFITLSQYDYSTDLMNGPNGEVVSGPSGSGVVPITTFLMAVASIIVCMKIVSDLCN